MTEQRTGHRYNAVRAAALAGSGRGKDAPKTGTTEGKRWPNQARRWLRAELGEWRRALAANPSARDQVRLALTRWQTDPDLVGLR